MRSRAPRRTAAARAAGAGAPAVPGAPGSAADAPEAGAHAAESPAEAAGSPAEAAGSPAEAALTSAEATFAAAVAAFTAAREAHARRNLSFADIPAPKRLAPYAAAIAATVRRDDADVAWGRLVLLYDPAGQQGWEGSFRLVAYVRSEIEPEIAADPLLGEVGWSWLAEALDAHVPGYAAPSGTVTRVITEGFGAKRDEPPLTGFELRASWSPAGSDDPPGGSDPGAVDPLDLPAHIAAWCDCLAAAAGLEPPGTRALRQPGRG